MLDENSDELCEDLPLRSRARLSEDPLPMRSYGVTRTSQLIRNAFVVNPENRQRENFSLPRTEREPLRVNLEHRPERGFVREDHHDWRRNETPS